MAFEPAATDGPPAPAPAAAPPTCPMRRPPAGPAPPADAVLRGVEGAAGVRRPALVVLVLRRGTRGLEWVPVAATLAAVAVGWAMLG